MLLSLCFDFLLFYEHEGVLLQSLILVSTVAYRSMHHRTLSITRVLSSPTHFSATCVMLFSREGVTYVADATRLASPDAVLRLAVIDVRALITCLSCTNTCT